MKSRGLVLECADELRGRGAAGRIRPDAASAAMQIMSLIDGLSVQAVVRGILDYAAVRAMVTTMTEQLLHLDAGQLSPAGSMSESHMAN